MPVSVKVMYSEQRKLVHKEKLRSKGGRLRHQEQDLPTGRIKFYPLRLEE